MKRLSDCLWCTGLSCESKVVFAKSQASVLPGPTRVRRQKQRANARGFFASNRMVLEREAPSNLALRDDSTGL